MRRPVRSVITTLVIAAALGLSAIPAHAALSIDADDTWGTNGKVNAILRVGGTIYLGGDFTALQSDADAVIARNHLAAIDASTGEPTSFDPNVDASVFGLAASADGSRLYAVGNFNAVGGQVRKKIAAFDLPTGALSSWKPPAWPNNVVRAVAVTADHVYLGGSFTNIGSANPRTRLAALSPTDGSILSSWTPAADGLVRDIVIAAGRAFLAGNFNAINGTTGRSLAAVDPVSGSLISGVYHPNYPVLDIEAGSTRLYGAGGGGGGKAFATTLPAGTRVWEKKTDGNVQGVGILSGVPYFGGHFFKYDGKAVEQMVRADPATGALDTTWVPSVTSGFLGVFAVHAFSGKLYIGGDFTRVSNAKQLNFAAFSDAAVGPSADLGIGLTDAPDPVDVGGLLTYTAHVSNAGPDAATGVTVVDVLPAGVSFASASAGCSNGAGTVTCDLGTVAVGGGATAIITVTAGSPGVVANAVTVTSDATDPASANDQASASTTIAPVAGTADLHLVGTPSSGDTVDQAAAFDYVLTITNQGSASTPDAIVTDVLPANVSPNGSASASQGSCSGSSSVSCSLGALSPGAAATVTIPVTAPGSPQTIVNSATVTGPLQDPDTSDNQTVGYTSVRDPALGGDTVAPTKATAEMFDQNADGFVDRVVVTFDEGLAPCLTPCTAGWSVTNVPSDGVLQSVVTAGNQAILTIGAWADVPDTAVGTFTVGLSGPNLIQDAAGNHPSFGATGPTDGAGPVAVGFRKQHNSSASGCVGTTQTAGLAQVCDELTSEWSEALRASSIPATTTLTIADPPGAGNDTLSVGTFIGGSMDLGSDGYVTVDGGSASWIASKLTLSGAAADTLTVRILGACTGAGCSSLGTVLSVTVVYTPSSQITDVAGNPAGGHFSKTQSMF